MPFFKYVHLNGYNVSKCDHHIIIFIFRHLTEQYFIWMAKIIWPRDGSGNHTEKTRCRMGNYTLFWRIILYVGMVLILYVNRDSAYVRAISYILTNMAVTLCKNDVIMTSFRRIKRRNDVLLTSFLHCVPRGQALSA